jgi:Ca-activated chloride channel family protein
MKFIRYSKFKGFDVFGLDLGSLMNSLSGMLLDSGFHEDYWYTRERRPADDTLDGLREALLRALLENGVLDPLDVEKMLADNGGKFKGSLLEELINQLIERLVEEGYLDLEQKNAETEPGQGMGGQGETGEPLPRDIRFRLTEKGLDFLGYKTLRDLLGSVGRSSAGRHDTHYLDTGVEASLGAKQYEFGDTLNLDVNRTLLSAIGREGLGVPMNLEYGDLYVHQQDYQSSCATVVMLDCSHSMILYGEDRFTPAKKVTLALAHLIRTQYPGDTLDIVLFHDDAEQLPLAKLASTQVGPYHTNTAEGLKLARRVLSAKRYEADRYGHRRQAHGGFRRYRQSGVPELQALFRDQAGQPRPLQELHGQRSLCYGGDFQRGAGVRQSGDNDQHIHAGKRRLSCGFCERNDRDDPRQGVFREPGKSVAVCADGLYETPDEDGAVIPGRDVPFLLILPQTREKNGHLVIL